MDNKKMNHDRIDIFFLLNQKQIVTRSELYNLLPLQNYEEYQTSFYKRKLSDIFIRNCSVDWFLSVYSRDRQLEKHDFNVQGEYLIIKSVSNYHTEKDLWNNLQSLEGFIDLILFTLDANRGFRRDCYIKMEGVNVKDKHDEIRNKLNDFKLEFDYIQIKERSVDEPSEVNLTDVINVTKGICRLYGTTLEVVEKLYGESNLKTLNIMFPFLNTSFFTTILPLNSHGHL